MTFANKRLNNGIDRTTHDVQRAHFLLANYFYRSNCFLCHFDFDLYVYKICELSWLRARCKSSQNDGDKSNTVKHIYMKSNKTKKICILVTELSTIEDI